MLFFSSFFVQAMAMVARQTIKLANKAQAKISFQLPLLSNKLPLYGYILNYVLNVHTLPRHSVAENIVGTPVFARAVRRRVVVPLLCCLTSYQIHSTMS